MKSKIYCRSCEQLATYLEELTTYFDQYGVLPGEKDYIGLPDKGVLRIRFDEKKDGGKVEITVDWDTRGGIKPWSK